MLIFECCAHDVYPYSITAFKEKFLRSLQLIRSLYFKVQKLLVMLPAKYLLTQFLYFSNLYVFKPPHIKCRLNDAYDLLQFCFSMLPYWPIKSLWCTLITMPEMGDLLYENLVMYYFNVNKLYSLHKGKCFILCRQHQPKLPAAL